jgi:hypothetical protein
MHPKRVARKCTPIRTREKAIAEAATRNAAPRRRSKKKTATAIAKAAVA